MAKALTRPRGRRGKISDRHERELKRLLLSICDDTGFRLYLATYDQPKRRDELIARLVKEAEADKVRVTRLDLAAAGPEANLVGLLRAHLQRADLPPGWRQAVMVSGIEQRLDYSAGPKGFAFLHQANLLRDALPEAAPVPVVLWLSRMASAALPAEAPDLWHWRAANFDFTGDEAPRLEVLRELATLQPTDDGGGLSGEQRRARIAMLEELLAELEREGPPQSKRQAAERAALLLELGIEARYLGHPAEALHRVEEALAAYRKIGFREGEALALRMLGGAWLELGEPRQAIEYYGQHLAIAREMGDRRDEGEALGNLGTAHAALGEQRRAIECSEHRLAIAREVGDRQGEGHALGSLGIAYTALGDPQRAIEHHEQALAIARELGDRSREALVLGNLGHAYYFLLDLMRAIEHYMQQLKIARDVGDRWGEGHALGNLGKAYAALGEPRRAIEYYEQALTIMREIGARRDEGQTLFNTALVLEQLGERDEAIWRLEEALRIYEQIEDPNAARARAKLAEWRGGSGG